MLVNSGFQSVVLKKDLNLPMSFFVNARIIKILLSTLLAGLAVEYLFTVEFFSQSFLQRAIWLGLEIICIAGIYAVLLMIMGEGKAVLGIISKMTKKFTKK
jgi:hypothetical protein